MPKTIINNDTRQHVCLAALVRLGHCLLLAFNPSDLSDCNYLRRCTTGIVSRTQHYLVPSRRAMAGLLAVTVVLMAAIIAQFTLYIMQTMYEPDVAADITAAGGKIERLASGFDRLTSLFKGAENGHIYAILVVPSSNVDQVLLAATKLPCLVSVDIECRHVSAEALRRLSDLTTLRHLSLRGTDISDDDMVGLCRLRTLESLDISDTAITDADVRHVQALSSLRILMLQGTRVTEFSYGLVGYINKLEQLWLANTSVTDRGIEEVANAAGRIKTLNLHGTKITDKAAPYLMRLPLERLYLSETAITNDLCTALKATKSLREVNLGYDNIDDAGIKSLEELPQLTNLGLEHTSVSAEAIYECLKCCPKMQCIVVDADLLDVNTMKVKFPDIEVVTPTEPRTNGQK